MKERNKDRARNLLTRMDALVVRMQEATELSRVITSRLRSSELSSSERETIFRSLREVDEQHAAMSKEHDELTEELRRELDELVASPSIDDN